MKTIIKTATCFVVLILFGTSVSWLSAGDQPKPVGRHGEPDISKWDANQNGRIDNDEAAAFQRAKIRERQEQQEARRQAAIEARKLDEAARLTRMVPPTQVKQYDRNGNGLIDPNEWAVYRQDVNRQVAEKRAARLAAATNSAAPAIVISTNGLSRP
jgi:hypothetical protein